MQKLYQKSELWFSLVWIIVYVAGGSAADAASRTIGVEKIVTLPFLAILCAVALGWVKKQGLNQKYGLCRPKLRAAAFLWYIPLVIPVSCNLWYGVKWNMPLHETLLYMASMVCVGFLEELIFRGFLFKAMSRDGLTSAIVVSSVTFGIGHIVNLFNGSGAQLLSNLCQVVSAVAFGFLFVILFHRGGSIWPCIVTHCAINVLSAFAGDMTDGREILTAVILTGTNIAYTAVLLKTLPKDAADR